MDDLWGEFDMMKKECCPPPEIKQKKCVFGLCDICGGHKVYSGESLPTCTSCGRVDSVFISDEAEWVSSVDETGRVTDSARCGMPQDLALFSSQWGTSTMIKDSGRSKYRTRRLARMNFHMSMNHRDRALFHAYKDIDEAASKVLQLPDSVTREAKIMYRKFNSEKLTRGAIRTGIKANCLFFSCKLNNISRTTKEIADAYGIPTKDVSRTMDMFKEIIIESEKTETKITKSHDVLIRMLGNFTLGNDKRKTVMQCSRLCSKLEECTELMGKTPNSVAAVVIMKVLELSKQEIIEKCNVSLPTLNKIDTIAKKYLEDNHQ